MIMFAEKSGVVIVTVQYERKLKGRLTVVRQVHHNCKCSGRRKPITFISNQGDIHHASLPDSLIRIDFEDFAAFRERQFADREKQNEYSIGKAKQLKARL